MEEYRNQLVSSVLCYFFINTERDSKKTVRGCLSLHDEGSEKNFLAKQALQLNFPLTSHLHHPLTRKPLREKTATAGGRKQ